MVRVVLVWVPMVMLVLLVGPMVLVQMMLLFKLVSKAVLVLLDL
jgi:hypothetical protein